MAASRPCPLRGSIRKHTTCNLRNSNDNVCRFSSSSSSYNYNSIANAM